MADPPGLRMQVEQTFVQIMQQMIPSWTNTDVTPNVAHPIQYLGSYSDEEMHYPSITVECELGESHPTAAGNVLSDQPPHRGIPAVGVPVIWPPAPASYHNEIQGRWRDNVMLHCIIRTNLKSENQMLADQVTALWDAGQNGSGVPWWQVLAFYGMFLTGNHPDQTERVPQSQDIVDSPMVFQKVITYLLRTVSYNVPTVSTGIGVTFRETLVIPAGYAPPWTL